MGRHNRHRERSRSRKTSGNGTKMQATLRGLLSARRRLRKPQKDLNVQSITSMKRRARRSYHAGPIHPPRNRRSSGTEADQNCSSKLVNPTEKTYCRRRRKHQNQGAQIPQTPPLLTVSTNQSMERGRLVIDIGRHLDTKSPSDPPDQFVKLLQSVSNCEFPEAIAPPSAQEKRSQWVPEIVHDPQVHDVDHKVSPVCIEYESQIVNFHIQQAADIPNSALKFNSQYDEMLVVEKDNEALQQLCQKPWTAQYDRQLDTCYPLKKQLKHVHEPSVACTSFDKVIELQDLEILSQNETIDSLRSKVEELEKHKQCNTISGSYADGSPMPTLLNPAFFDAKTAITRVLKCLAPSWTKAIISKPYLLSVVSERVSELLNLDPSARTREVEYAFKAFVNQVFFEGFENESFNTNCGATKFVDPDRRQAKFFEYYQYAKEQHYANVIEDPQYKDFFKMKHETLWENLNLRRDSEEEVGGSQLTSSFEAAAKSVWLLHKLAFSFEPPANIFRVERDVDVDPDYMEPVEDLEDCKTCVSKVGFTVAPGLRLRKTVLRCQIYSSRVSSICQS